MTKSAHLSARRITLSACLVAVVLLPSCERRSTLERARTRGFIRAGYSEEPPYAFRDASGRVTGESPEAFRSVAERIGIPEIQWVRLDFKDLIPALLQGRIDVVAAGLFRTEARAREVRFSRPTLCSEPALVVRRGEGVSGDLASIAAEGVHVAVLAGSVEESAMRGLEIRPGRLLSVPDLTTGLAAVREGSVDALAVTAPTARFAVRNDGGERLEVRRYEAPPDLETPLSGCSAFAFRPGREDRELARVVDGALGEVLGSPDHLATIRSLGFSSREVRAATDSARSPRP